MTQVTQPPPTVPRRRYELKLSYQSYLLAVLLVLPAVLLRLFTTLYPFIETLILSAQRYNPAFPPQKFVGFGNFEKMMGDIVVTQSIEFTFIFVIIGTLFELLLGLAVAHLLNVNFPLRGFARTIALIPWAVPMVVVAVAFRWLFDSQFGMIPDLLLRFLSVEINWLLDANNSRIAVTAVNVWKNTPFVAILLLAGMQGIPGDLYEAARVDGANWWQQLRFITVPILKPIIISVGMFMIIWQVGVIDLPYAMTGGGPGVSTTVFAQKIFLEIISLNYGYASALSVAMLVFVIAIGAVGLFLFRRAEVN